MPTSARIALLATGDEIISGDILNTNTHYLAQQLTDHGMQPGLQITVGDSDAEIEQAIRLLLSQHQGVIISGGLGPTSDDRTRFALANYLQRPLLFHDSWWEKIIERLQSFGLTVPENNKQQCLFPEGATLLPNLNGTAAGCYVEHNGQFIFMLPGPPQELQPLMQQEVLPKLKQLNVAHTTPQCSWLLLGVSEGQLASEMDKLFERTDVILGYRACYPYLELKIRSENTDLLHSVEREIDKLLAKNIVSRHKQSASTQLRERIATKKTQLAIFDGATRGLLEATLTAPENHQQLRFCQKQLTAGQDTYVAITGLNALWQQQTTAQTTLTIEISNAQHSETIERTLPFRGFRSREFAMEMICWELLQKL